MNVANLSTRTVNIDSIVKMECTLCHNVIVICFIIIESGSNDILNYLIGGKIGKFWAGKTFIEELSGRL